MKIKKVQKSSKKVNTYDISVENTHSYQLENGMVSHNTVSLLCNTSSGIHPRYGKYIIRRVRQDMKDPLSKMMIDQGIPYVLDNDKYIFDFYIKSPEHSRCQSEVGAMNQLELWKVYADNWCDGNPSQTIYYNDSEFLTIADWVWKNWDDIGGLSFFPGSDDSIYENAPLEEISKEVYEELCKGFPSKIDWSKLSEYEVTDNTTGSQEVACSGGACELT